MRAAPEEANLDPRVRRVLVVGVSGYLGAALAQGLREDFDVFGTFHRHPCRVEGLTCLPLNLNNGGEVLETLKRIRPDVVLYAPGLRSPDACEEDRALAETLHFKAATIFLKLSPYPLRFVYFSVDEVFGLASPSRPLGFVETDTPMPSNFLSRSRFSGEVAILAHRKSSVVVRLPDCYGENFRPGLHLRSNWLMEVGERLHRGEPVLLAKDQARSPLYIGDAIRATKRLLDDFELGRSSDTYHWAGPEGRSPYDLAVEAAGILGWDPSLLKPGAAPRGKASRPVDARLDATKFSKSFNFRFQSPSEGLTELAERLRTGHTSRWPS